MAYTLKSAWSSRAVACVAVDQDGTTVKDFVTANTMAAHANVTAGVGSATWKGNSLPYFPTIANGSFDFYGLTWSGTKPSQNFDPGYSWIILLNSYTSGSFVLLNNNAGYGIKLSSSRPQVFAGVGIVTGATALATSTKQGVMGIFRKSGTCEIHYGLESGSMAQDATATDANLPGDQDITSYGGSAGQGNFVANTHLLLVTNDVISNTDRDAVFSDPIGTLFDTSSSSALPVISRSHARRRNT
jgi:hypothetical protein